jgi:hypothetical protein
LSKGFFNGFIHVEPLGSYDGKISFLRGPSLRRDLCVGTALIGSTASNNYSSAMSTGWEILSYGAVGRLNNSLGNNYSSTSATSILLPTASATANPAYAADSNPVFHSLPFNPYVSESLPSDFGLTFHYASNAFEPGDTLVVTAGTEEWEVLADEPSTAAETGATPLFVARMV